MGCLVNWVEVVPVRDLGDDRRKWTDDDGLRVLVEAVQAQKDAPCARVVCCLRPRRANGNVVVAIGFPGHENAGVYGVVLTCPRP